MVKAFITIGNKDSEATQTEVAKRAGFNVNLLGKSVVGRDANGKTEHRWTTQHGIIVLSAAGKLSLLKQLDTTILAENKNNQTMEQQTQTAAPANANPNARLVPLAQIKIQKNFNVRKDMGDLEGLANEIEAAGMWNPLTVRELKDGSFALTHGERRYKALQILEKRGVAFEGVEVMVIDPATSEVELEVSQLLQNDGKPLTLLEQGEVYKRLDKLGLDNSKIAKKTGYTTEHIRNCKKLAEAPEELKMAVTRGEVSGTAAIGLVKGEKDKGKIIEKLNKAKAAPKTKQKGSKKITAKNLQGEEKPKSNTSPAAIVARVKEVQDGMVVTQKEKKFSEQRVWEILKWCLDGVGGESAIKKLIL